MTFDLEKARDVARFMITHNCYGGERFADTLAEVERLQALNPFNVNTQVGIRINDNVFAYSDGESAAILQNLLLTKDARIQELKDDLETAKASLRFDKEEIEQLRVEMENYGDDYVCQMKSKDARIQELEEALAEYRKLGKTIAGKVPCLTLHGDCGRCSTQAREVCGALEQLAAGKIGPDATRRSWQITEERKAAIERLIIPVEFLLVDHDTDPEIEEAVAVLWAMLKEAEQ